MTLAIFSRHVKIPSNIANHTRQAKMNCQAIKIPNGHAIISILASVYADSRSFENWCKILYHKPIENIEFRMKLPVTFPKPCLHYKPWPGLRPNFGSVNTLWSGLGLAYAWILVV